MPTVPLSGTNIRLLSGVPFSNDYKHTRWFDYISDQGNYFLNKPVVHSMTEANFQRIEGYNFVAVNKSVDELWNCNYMMFQNAAYNNKWFYAFVTKLEYKQRNTTYVHFEIDVLQTWRFEAAFQPSFVVREHCPLWNADGSPVLNTVDEGLNYGSEYDNVYINQLQPNAGYKWLVILAKSTIHAQSGDLTNEYGVSFPANSIIPTVIGTPQPLSVYLLPFTDNNVVPSITLANGTVPLMSTPTELLHGLYLSTDAVNNIVSIYVTDYTGIPVTATDGHITFPDNNNEILGISFTAGSDTYRCLYVQSVWNFEAQLYDEGPKYDGFKPVTESKLLMYPYCVTTLDDFKGNRATIRNEYLYHTNLHILLKGSLGPANKTSYTLPDYNYIDDNAYFRTFISDENGVMNNTPNDVPIISDYLSAYIQGNKNSIENQKNQTIFNGYATIANGAFNSAMGAQMMGSMGAAQGVGNTAQGLGNNVFQLQGILAKLQDINNIPPQMAKMGSNTSYTIGNGYDGLYIIKKQIKDEYMKKLSDFFNMFGYKKNEVKYPNFHTRSKWNFVQTNGCIITGNINNEDINDMKSIFDNGITLWHVDDIGNYALSNEVIA